MSSTDLGVETPEAGPEVTSQTTSAAEGVSADARAQEDTSKTDPSAEAVTVPDINSSGSGPSEALALVPTERNEQTLPTVEASAAGPEQEAPDPQTSRQPSLARLFAFAQPRPADTALAVADVTRKGSRGDPRPPVDPSPGTNDLPGVRLGSLFGIDTGTANAEQETIQIASVAGLARLAPGGLRAQSDKVEMDCFKPELIRLLDKVRRHYGRDILVTSGYRSPKHNRRAGGARGSRHTTCEAADIQVPGVSKRDLASYLRTVEGRGGVGTYCHTRSVHIDTGPQRDWNWRCQRR